ncbi:MAG: TonB-dependent receptor, partial [Caulobacteraceae bacterium]
MGWNRITAAGLLAGVSVTVMAAAQAVAAAPSMQAYALEPQDLGQALRRIALISGRQVVAASNLVAGKRSAAVNGRFTAEQAYAAALSGAGLQMSSVGGMLVVVQAPAELRPPASAPPPPQAVSELTITGTRIRGQAPVGSNLIVIDRSAIDQSGYASTAQLLAALPQNFGGGATETTAGFSLRNNANLNQSFGSSVNLRGLGDDSTLVLLNGQRPALGGLGGAFADISMVPSSIIKRVEVLADGASALYGSDAVAGVVNFIFRDDFEGAETTAHYGTDGDFSEVQVSQILGANWGSGHAVFAYEYYDRTALPAADRPYATEDLVPFGGQDYRSPFAAPGNILAGAASFAIPQGSTGVGLTPSQLLPGQTNLSDQIRATDLLPDQQRHSVYGSLHQDLGWDTTVFVQGLFAERAFVDHTLPTGQAPFTVPTTNPFYVDPIGTRQPVTVEYNLNADLGAPVDHGMVQAYDAEVGLDHRFGAWTGELLAGYGREREFTGAYNLVNQAAAADALADTNPATALNVFGSGASNNPATLNAVRGWVDDTSHSTVWSVSGKFDGPLFDLPAGTVRMAFGGEYRVESYDYVETLQFVSLQPEVVPLSDIPGPRSIAAGYGELLIPLVGPDMHVPAIRRLDLSVAGRFEHYSDVGDTANPKVGLNWSVVPGVDLRLAYGTSFRAPTFDELRFGPGDVIYAPIALADPKSPAGVTNALVLIGNSPTLKPETATTWNAGIDLKPDWAPGLKASLGYYVVDFRDRIQAPTSDILSLLENRSTFAGIINAQPTAAAIAAYYASPNLDNPENIPASAITTIIDNRVQNLAQVHQDGLDFDAGY